MVLALEQIGINRTWIDFGCDLEEDSLTTEIENCSSSIGNKKKKIMWHNLPQQNVI